MSSVIQYEIHRFFTQAGFCKTSLSVGSTQTYSAIPYEYLMSWNITIVFPHRKQKCVKGNDMWCVIG